jgi:tetraacyldisaccharide 4'-kinase
MLNKLQQAWYQGEGWVWCLFPLTALFWAITSLRRGLYRVGLIPSKQANIPVVVVGNIGIGGNGKTPLVLALVEELRRRGFTPAVLSRGYGGNQSTFPYLLAPSDVASKVGDEPALIQQRANCAVVIDPVRSRGVCFIEQLGSVDVVICDDGLQHYAMKRDVELCVLDKRKLGNGYLLPMGPLREGKWRLKTVDAIVNNVGYKSQHDAPIIDDTKRSSQMGTKEKAHSHAQEKSKPNDFTMHLVPACWVNINNQEIKSLAQFKQTIESASNPTNVTALAGIGDPKRFFDTLNSLGIATTKNIGFNDHHHFTKQDIPKNGWVLMTEKDAVKCVGIVHSQAWYLRINAVMSEDFYDLIEKGIQTKANRLVKSRA